MSFDPPRSWSAPPGTGHGKPERHIEVTALNNTISNLHHAINDLQHTVEEVAPLIDLQLREVLNRSRDEVARSLGVPREQMRGIQYRVPVMETLRQALGDNAAKAWTFAMAAELLLQPNHIRSAGDEAVHPGGLAPKQAAVAAMEAGINSEEEAMSLLVTFLGLTGASN